VVQPLESKVKFNPEETAHSTKDDGDSCKDGEIIDDDDVGISKELIQLNKL
jgi:hypothetical protein